MSGRIGTYGSWRLRCMSGVSIYVMEFFEFYGIMKLREIFAWNSGTHIMLILKK